MSQSEEDSFTFEQDESDQDDETNNLVSAALVEIGKAKGFVMVTNSPEQMEWVVSSLVEDSNEITSSFAARLKYQELILLMECQNSSMQSHIKQIGIDSFLKQLNQFNQKDEYNVKAFWNCQLSTLSLKATIPILSLKQADKQYLGQWINILETNFCELLKNLWAYSIKMSQIRQKQEVSLKKLLDSDTDLKQKISQMKKIQKQMQYLNKKNSKPSFKQKQKKILWDNQQTSKTGEQNNSILQLIHIIKIEVDENSAQKTVKELSKEKIIPFISTFELFSCSSVNQDTHAFLQTFQKEGETTATKKMKENCPLIGKQKVSQDSNHFENEKYIINQLRMGRCPYIASYFSEICTSFAETKMFYIQRYPATLQSAKIPQRSRIKILTELSSCLQFIQEKGIAHRDLKPTNIALNGDLTPKLIDFESAIFTKSSQESANTLYTTKYYNILYSELDQTLKDSMTKEEFEGHELFDMYSLGKLIEVLLLDGQISCRAGTRLLEYLQFLVSACCQPDPRLRPTPFQVTTYLCCYLSLFSRQP